MRARRARTHKEKTECAYSVLPIVRKVRFVYAAAKLLTFPKDKRNLFTPCKGARYDDEN